MSRGPVNPCLREELIEAAKKQNFFTSAHTIYYSNLQTAWDNQRKRKRVRHEPPCKRVIKKFFTRVENHDDWLIEGLCWILLDKPLKKWENEHGVIVSSPKKNGRAPTNLKKPLSGLWLSHYSYTGIKPDGTSFNANQLSLEYISIERGKIKGQNIVGVSDNSTPHHYTFQGDLYFNQFVAGIWISKGQDHIGSFLLFFHPTKHLLVGKHLGNDEQNKIQDGPWTWIKINPDKLNVTEILNNPEAVELKDYQSLYQVFDAAQNTVEPIEFNAIVKEGSENGSGC